MTGLREQIAAAAEDYFASVRDDGYIVDCVTGESLADAIISRLGLTEERRVHVAWTREPVGIRVDANAGDVLKDERRWVSGWSVVGDEK